MDDDPDLDALAAQYAHWRVWRNNSLVYGWRLNSTPPIVLRDATVAGLRSRMVEWERVFEATGSPMSALAAAERLET